LGWATITHPFHPLRSRRFEVLKTRRVAGTDTLILRHPDRGSYTVARDWTDWGLPDVSIEPTGTTHKLSFEPLLQLADLCAKLSEHVPEELDE
jgi:hypothetical protein